MDSGTLTPLRGHLEAAVQSGLPGAVAVAAGPGFRWEEAAGTADVESHAPMMPAHRFRVGSVTKTFVAALVLQLADEGALELGGGVEPIVNGVTVRQLLNHTSGVPDLFDDLVEFFEPYREDPTRRFELGPREMLALALKKPRLFPPGEGWSYSSSGYTALGLLVEHVTGSSLREELKRRIFEPLGLEATDLPDDQARASGLARGYLPPDNPLVPSPRVLDVTELDFPSWAGGGIVSSAGDIARFLQALLGGELLPAGARAELQKTVPSSWEESDAYGLGIEVMTSLMGMSPSPCGPAWGHLGFGLGYTTIALASEDGERQVVVLTNGIVVSDEPWQPLGRLVWAGYCGIA
jgi:D-alanyl-D-alanine carboxypeptidase